MSGSQAATNAVAPLVNAGAPAVNAVPAVAPDVYFGALESVMCIQIREKANVIEAASAIIGQEVEMANKYNIIDKGTGKQVFYAVETTSFCMRQVKQLCNECAPWKVDILAGAGPEQMAQAMKMERQWTWTFCCLNRPVVSITDAQSNALLGKIVDPCVCCNLNFEVTDGADKPIVQVAGGCCQWGICCPLPCGPCKEVSFDLKDPASGEQVGTLKKKVPGALQFFLAPDVDNYNLEFSNPSAWTGKKKAMAMALAIFMDFRLFSNNRNDNNGGLVGQLNSS